MRRTSSARGRAQAGFTLVEVMVALLITVIAVIGILALYMVETRASGYSRHETEASVLAEDKMELLRTTTPPAVAALIGTDATLDELGNNVPSGIYQRDWSITPVGPPGPVVYWDYVVTVKWFEDTFPRTVTERSRL